MKKTNIKALLWDMDGLFIDTEELHFQAWQWMVASVGAEPLSLREYMVCVGRPGKENVETICKMKGITADTEHLRLVRREKYEELRRDGTPIIDEHVELAKKFSREYPNLRQILVSSSSRADIDANVSLIGLDDFFEFTVSYEDVPGMVRKPAPDMYLFTLKKLGLRAEECVAFEDSRSGVVSAIQAGIPTVALPNRLTVEGDFSGAKMSILPGEKKNPKEILEKISE